jgi:hypothetical protein
MSYKIYLIEDINGLKYVGSTKQNVGDRVAGHKYKSKHRKLRQCSSNLLDCDNWKWYILEECSKENVKEREYYWINKTECVNIKKGIYAMCKDKKKYVNDYDMKKYGMTKSTYWHRYNLSWGGDKRFQNNLLAIDVNLFNY